MRHDCSNHRISSCGLKKLAKFVAVVQKLAKEAEGVLGWVYADTIQGYVTI
jgi:hypothetical protein